MPCKENVATQLLYRCDAYLREFEAEVLKVVKQDNSFGVVLDRTAFYPGGGGQPADWGVIKGRRGEIKVVNVQRTENMIVHVASQIFGKIERGDHVKGVLDWNRRYALMRNHTTAHLMAEAVRKALGAPVKIVSSAVEVKKARLDFNYDGSLKPFFSKIEEAANRVVEEDRKVIVKVMPRKKAERYVKRFHESLKILPPQVQEVRIVEVQDWHACACGGTHVKSTGELGRVKILGRRSKGKGVERVEFASEKP
ncbi:MAG: alanyl-tRNA editing protein [Thermoproteota archaeon]|nr:alanyl-tRNA editing protein [Thermoproteota archaeon]